MEEESTEDVEIPSLCTCKGPKVHDSSYLAMLPTATEYNEWAFSMLGEEGGAAIYNQRQSQHERLKKDDISTSFDEGRWWD